MREVYPGACPACGCEIQIVHHHLEIPHFPDLLLVSIACDACGYRHVDTIIPEEGEPVQWTVRVEDLEDLSIKVVRSMTGTIEIPELGLMVEPGAACEGFITNIEGVLSRFEGAVAGILASAESDEEREAAFKMQEKIVAAREVDFPFTVIIKDPAGNSALVSKKASRAHIDTIT